MPDPAKEVEVKLRATGGQQAEETIAEMQASLARLRDEVAKVAAANPGASATADELEHSLTEAERGAVRAQGALRGLEQSLKTTGTGSRNSGLAMLEFSRALEDAQYGLSGVLNNIPGLLSMMGAGAGLAGVVSIAAIGVLKAAQAIGGLIESIDRARKAAQIGFPELSDGAAIAAEAATEAADSYERLEKSLDSIASARARHAGSLAAEAKATDDLARAQLELQEAEIDRAAARGEIDSTEADEAKREARRRAEDERIARERSELERRAEEAKRAESEVLEEYRDAASPVGPFAQAQDDLNRVSGPRNRVRELQPEIDRRDAAVAAFADAKTAASGIFVSEEEMAALEAAKAEMEEADKALAEAQRALIEAKREAAVSAREDVEALRRRAEDAAQQRRDAETELQRFDTTEGAARDARRQAEDVRNETKREQSANQNQVAVPDSVVAEVTGAIEMANQSNQPLVETLKKIATAMRDGTDSAELKQVQALLETAVGAIEATDRGGRARLANLEARINRLADQAASQRSYTP